MTGAPKIRVVLADDSTFVRRAFTRVLRGQPDIEVVGEAADGGAALELCSRLLPDVMLLDQQMPVRDGLATLEALRNLKLPTRVVMVSASTQRGAETTLIALEKGAFDFVDKGAVSSKMELHELRDALLQKVRSAGIRTGVAPARSWDARPLATIEHPELLALGASTGGPLALATLLSGLPLDFPAPVVIVQHIPASFIAPLASRLSRTANRPAQEVQPGQKLEPGRIYVAGGGHEAELFRRDDDLAIVWRRAAPGTPHVPSIDTLFHSAARVCGARAWAALLTGMGRDGAEGLLALRHAGALTVAQDEASSAVWGMPRAACELDAACAVLPVHELGPFFAEQVRRVTPRSDPRASSRKEAGCARR